MQALRGFTWQDRPAAFSWRYSTVKSCYWSLPHLSFWLHHSPLIDLVPLFLRLVSSLADCQQENQHEGRLTKERIGQSRSHILPILQSWTWNCKSVSSSISYTVWVYLLFWWGSLGCHSKELTILLPTFFSGLNFVTGKVQKKVPPAKSYAIICLSC